MKIYQVLFYFFSNLFQGFFCGELHKFSLNPYKKRDIFYKEKLKISKIFIFTMKHRDFLDPELPALKNVRCRPSSTYMGRRLAFIYRRQGLEGLLS